MARGVAAESVRAVRTRSKVSEVVAVMTGDCTRW
jgi:hypothetical protein